MAGEKGRHVSGALLAYRAFVEFEQELVAVVGSEAERQG